MRVGRRHMLSIGAFAGASRLSRKALRLYERTGILSPADTDPSSGYRYYRPDQLPRARLIRTLRQVEMPLATIGKVLASEPEDAAKLVAEYERSFSARVVGAHRAIRDVLSGLRNKEAAMPYEVAVKELDPQLMVSKTSRTRITELEETMASSLSSLREFAARQSGEITGRPVGIYHGPINEEADGPIEVCLPVSGAFSPTGDIVVRELEGGNAAQASVHGDECKFPAILKAYDAAVDWIAQHGYESAGPPMELWPDEPGQMERITVVWPFAKPR